METWNARTRTIHVSVLWLVVALAGAGVLPASGQPIAVPVLEAWERFDRDQVAAWILAGDSPAGPAGWRPGLAVLCDARTGPSITAYFGPFPLDRRAVQFAVRRSDQVIERVGPVVSGGPESGFHDPVIEDPVDVVRMGRALIQNNAFISNGYFSFWNRASSRANERVLAELEACPALGSPR